jgi:hypothetical protein
MAVGIQHARCVVVFPQEVSPHGQHTLAQRHSYRRADGLLFSKDVRARVDWVAQVTYIAVVTCYHKPYGGQVVRGLFTHELSLRQEPVELRTRRVRLDTFPSMYYSILTELWQICHEPASSRTQASVCDCEGSASGAPSSIAISCALMCISPVVHWRAAHGKVRFRSNWRKQLQMRQIERVQVRRNWWDVCLLI